MIVLVYYMCIVGIKFYMRDICKKTNEIEKWF